MTSEQIDRLITGILDLAKVALGSVITLYLTSWKTNRSEGKRLRKELGKHQFAIVSENVANRYQLHFEALRNFYTEHFELMTKHPYNLEFFREWLQHPFRGTEFSDPSWTNEMIAKLQSDVQKLRI